MNNLKAQWPWNEDFLKLFIQGPFFLGLLATAVSYPYAGIYALWFLSAIPAGLVIRLMYASIGRRVNDLKMQYRSDSANLAEGLLVIGMIEAPGIVVLRDDELVLANIVGKTFSIPRDEIKVFREGRMLPGKFLWGKRAFILARVENTRLGFAVEEKLGRKWSSVFKQAKSRPMAQQTTKDNPDPRPGQSGDQQ